MEQPSSRRGTGVIVGVLIALLGAGGLVYAMRQQNSSTPSTPGGSLSVVVAKTTIARGSRISADNVGLQNVPRSLVPPGAFTTVASVDGRLVGTDVPANIPITTAALVSSVAGAGSAGAAGAGATAPLPAPLDIHKGYVAMAVPVDEQRGVGGFIQAEDHIDVLADLKNDQHIRYVLQDVRVLRAGGIAAQPAPAPSGQAAPAAAPAGATTLLVVELPRAQAEEMSYLLTTKQITSFFRYVLRSKDESSKPGAPQVLLNTEPIANNAYKDPGVSPETMEKAFPA